MNRRHFLATIAAAAMPLRHDMPPWPTWATDWNDACHDLARMELHANQQQYPKTWRSLTYTGCCTWGKETLLFYGIGTPMPLHAWQEALGPESILGRGQYGPAWAAIALGVLSPMLQAELRADAVQRERRESRAEARA